MLTLGTVFQDWQSSRSVAKLIYKEFFTQGDLEKAMGNNPLVMMDREKAFIPELQLSFLDNIALPVYESVFIIILIIVYILDYLDFLTTSPSLYTSGCSL